MFGNTQTLHSDWVWWSGPNLLPVDADDLPSLLNSGLYKLIRKDNVTISIYDTEVNRKVNYPTRQEPQSHSFSRN